jgi:hypothetical protein
MGDQDGQHNVNSGVRVRHSKRRAAFESVLCATVREILARLTDCAPNRHHHRPICDGLAG